jgi:hypothetical protein
MSRELYLLFRCRRDQSCGVRRRGCRTRTSRREVESFEAINRCRQRIGIRDRLARRTGVARRTNVDGKAREAGILDSRGEIRKILSSETKETDVDATFARRRGSVRVERRRGGKE